MRDGRFLFAAMLAAAVMSVLPAAAQVDDDPDADIAALAPPIHVEQVVLLVRDGEPVDEDNYRKALFDCRQMPNVDTVALDAEIVPKLGRSFVVTQYDGVRMARRVDRWDFSEGDGQGLCRFQPVHDAWLEVDEPGRSTRIDLVAGTAEIQPSDGVVRHPLPRQTAADDALRAQVAAAAAADGNGGLAADIRQKPAASSEAGQPCEQRHSPLGRVCIWSGGHQWGFTSESGDVTTDPAASMDAIPLRVEPDGETGERWTTTAMTVGGRPDPALFTLAAGFKPAGN